MQIESFLEHYVSPILKRIALKVYLRWNPVWSAFLHMSNWNDQCVFCCEVFALNDMLVCQVFCDLLMYNVYVDLLIMDLFIELCRCFIMRIYIIMNSCHKHDLVVYHLLKMSDFRLLSRHYTYNWIQCKFTPGLFHNFLSRFDFPVLNSRFYAHSR